MREIQSCTTVIVSLLYFILLILLFGFNKYEQYTFVLNCQQSSIVETVWDFFFWFCFFGQCRSSVELCFKLIWRHDGKYRRSFNGLKRWTWKYIRIYTHTYTQREINYWKWLKALGDLLEHIMYSDLIRLILILKVDVDISQKLQLN